MGDGDTRRPSAGAVKAARRALSVFSDADCDAADCEDGCAPNFCRLDVHPVAAAIDAERARMAMAKERIAHLEKYVGDHLYETGACSDADPDGDESLCESPNCTYCQMARALQPIECGMPLPTEATNG